MIADPVWEIARLVDRLPERSGDVVAVRDETSDGGGSAINVACALAVAGRRVLVVGRTGDDDDGRAAVAAMRRRGVETRVNLVRGGATKCIHEYVESGTGRVAFESTAPPDRAEPWNEPVAEIREGRILWLDRLAPASDAWIAERRASRLINAFNAPGPGPRGSLDDRVVGALPLLDWLQIAEADGPPEPAPPDRGALHRPTAFSPLSNLQVQEILGASISVLIRTRGSRGVRIDTGDGTWIELGAVPTTVVDPTGAGDAFAAGWIDGILRGAPIADAARRGIDWAARACRHLGARGWLDHNAPESE